jgi:histidyl-tRNA synthetase
MVDEKGLNPAVADKISTFVKSDVEIKIGEPCGERSKQVLASLLANEELYANPTAKEGIDELKLLFSYLDIWGCTDSIALDMSLARGLDYYTGVIYEVISEGSAPSTKTDGKPARKPRPPKVSGDTAPIKTDGELASKPESAVAPEGSAPVEGTAAPTKTDDKPARAPKKPKKDDGDEDRSNDPSVGIGSIAAGGRYDGLVNMFSRKDNKTPCVGISFGVDRIFSIIKRRMEDAKSAADAVIRPTETDVYVMALGGKGCLPERMQVAQELWDAGIRAEFTWKVKPKLPQQFKAAENGGVPLAVILGEDELARGEVKIKEMGLPEGHPEKEGVQIKREDLIPELKKRLQNSDMSLAETLKALKV